MAGIASAGKGKSDIKSDILMTDDAVDSSFDDESLTTKSLKTAPDVSLLEPDEEYINISGDSKRVKIQSSGRNAQSQRGSRKKVPRSQGGLSGVREAPARSGCLT